ncbi:MAG TPA: hypothetical protein VK203_23575 [Nostocaceae cyanobacterium]|nr:hypothetical protein [Nostocaceae cyanobacterium]
MGLFLPCCNSTLLLVTHRLYQYATFGTKLQSNCKVFSMARGLGIGDWGIENHFSLILLICLIPTFHVAGLKMAA